MIQNATVNVPICLRVPKTQRTVLLMQAAQRAGVRMLITATQRPAEMPLCGGEPTQQDDANRQRVIKRHERRQVRSESQNDVDRAQ